MFFSKYRKTKQKLAPLATPKKIQLALQKSRICQQKLNTDRKLTNRSERIRF